MFWDHWEEEGTRGQETTTVITEGRAGDLRVRSSSVISPVALRISESVSSTAEWGLRGLPVKTRCHSDVVVRGKAHCKWCRVSKWEGLLGPAYSSVLL